MNRAERRARRGRGGERAHAPGHRHCDNECPRCHVHGEGVGLVLGGEEGRAELEAWMDGGKVGQLKATALLRCPACGQEFEGPAYLEDGGPGEIAMGMGS